MSCLHAGKRAVFAAFHAASESRQHGFHITLQTSQKATGPFTDLSASAITGVQQYFRLRQ
jgi:hypothetical protein